MRGTGAGASVAPRKRRPPNPREQARRKIWGKTWGSFNSRAAKALRKDAAQ